MLQTEQWQKFTRLCLKVDSCWSFYVVQVQEVQLPTPTQKEHYDLDD